MRSNRVGNCHGAQLWTLYQYAELWDTGNSADTSANEEYFITPKSEAKSLLRQHDVLAEVSEIN